MAAPTIIGKKGYRWRGKSIRTVIKNEATCVSMPRKDSTVMCPVALQPGAQYKITITASKNSGNGALLVNFFGGKHYDGKPISINIKTGDIRDYTISVSAPKFPKNIPMYLRVYRPNDASGTVYIKTIAYIMLGGEIKRPREPKLRQSSKSQILRPIKPIKPSKKEKETLKDKKTPLPPAVKPKECRDMKFKPYKFRGNISVVEKVLVNQEDKVPKVSIITPTRNGIDLLKKCYKSIKDNTCYPNWEWIVGDSDSTDGTAEYIKKLNDPKIKLIERGTTEGSFSSINNELASYATGEYYLFLNDDTQPQPFWLFEMMSKILRDPEIGIVGAKLLYAKGRIQHAGIAFIPQGPANLGKSVLGSFPKNFDAYDRYYQAVTAACLLISEKDFRAVGMFDPVYYFCYEDVDLCLKVGEQLNKKVLYAARAEVIHAESVTQKKHKTAGEKQQKGIEAFKDRWMSKVDIDFPKYQRNINMNKYRIDISFVTCVNNFPQYRSYVLGSLLKSSTKKHYETIPVLNFGNSYSAAKALNIGLDKSHGSIVVFCHQDVLFYENWIDLLYERIEEIELQTKNWGVLGTAGITKRDDTAGVVHNMRGKLQWQASKRKRVMQVQTVDEHCMIIRKSSGLRFDDNVFDGFHFYGPDLCMTAQHRKMVNFGILCPLVHDSKSGSLISGKREFMRLLNALARKWRPVFNFIRTPTSVIRRRSVRTFVRFK